MPEDAETLEWRCQPVRERPVAGLLVALLIAFLTVGAQLSFEDPVLTVLSAVVLSVSVAPFYLPTRYRIADDRVSIRSVFGRKEKSLKLYRRIAADRRGVLLSPFDQPSRLDKFHGLNLRFDSADRERVLDFLGRRFTGHDREA
jgi:hypothetical protein